MTAQTSDLISYQQSEWLVRCHIAIPNDLLISVNCDDSIFLSTACRRGYLAKWEIDREQLFIQSVNGRYVLKDSVRHKANWVDGPIKIGRGMVVKYVHMGYDSSLEQEIALWCFMGNIVSYSKWLSSGSFFRRFKIRSMRLIHGFLSWFLSIGNSECDKNFRPTR